MKVEVCRSGIATQGKNFACWAKRGVGFSLVPTEEAISWHMQSYKQVANSTRVSEGDVIEVEKLDVEAGADARFEQVLLVSDGAGISIGSPLVSGAAVTAEVVEQTKAPKVIAFKYKRRKGYHRTVGHRRQITRLKIKTISA